MPQPFSIPMFNAVEITAQYEIIDERDRAHPINALFTREQFQGEMVTIRRLLSKPSRVLHTSQDGRAMPVPHEDLEELNYKPSWIKLFDALKSSELSLFVDYEEFNNLNDQSGRQKARLVGINKALARIAKRFQTGDAEERHVLNCGALLGTYTYKVGAKTNTVDLGLTQLTGPTRTLPFLGADSGDVITTYGTGGNAATAWPHRVGVGDTVTVNDFEGGGTAVPGDYVVATVPSATTFTLTGFAPSADITSGTVTLPSSWDDPEAQIVSDIGNWYNEFIESNPAGLAPTHMFYNPKGMRNYWLNNAQWQETMSANPALALWFTGQRNGTTAAVDFIDLDGQITDPLFDLIWVPVRGTYKNYEGGGNVDRWPVNKLVLARLGSDGCQPKWYMPFDPLQLPDAQPNIETKLPQEGDDVKTAQSVFFDAGLPAFEFPELVMVVTVTR